MKSLCCQFLKLPPPPWSVLVPGARRQSLGGAASKTPPAIKRAVKGKFNGTGGQRVAANASRQEGGQGVGGARTSDDGLDSKKRMFIDLTTSCADADASYVTSYIDQTAKQARFGV
jgi:hypothetical protein